MGAKGTFRLRLFAFLHQINGLLVEILQRVYYILIHTTHPFRAPTV